MKRMIKRVAATTFSIVGILSTLPSAFCAPDGEKTAGGKQLDKFNMMVVAKYLQTPEDLAKLAMVNQKFKDILETFNYNPVKSYDKKITPNLRICFVDSSKGDKPLAFPEYDKLRKKLNFVRTYFRSGITKKTSQPKENPYSMDESSYVITDESIKEIIYRAGTFTYKQLELALQVNCVCEATGWDVETVFVKENDPYRGVDLVFTSRNKKQLVFQFRPQGTVRKDSNNPDIVNYNANKIIRYNSFLEKCGIVDKKFHVQFREFKK